MPNTMRLLSWNCQGLGNPWIIRSLRKLVRDQAPTVCFLMETRLDREGFDNKCDDLPFQNKVVVKKPNSRGGLAFVVEVTGLTRCNKLHGQLHSHKSGRGGRFRMDAYMLLWLAGGKPKKQDLGATLPYFFIGTWPMVLHRRLQCHTTFFRKTKQVPTSFQTNGGVSHGFGFLQPCGPRFYWI